MVEDRGEEALEVAVQKLGAAGAQLVVVLTAEEVGNGLDAAANEVGLDCPIGQQQAVPTGHLVLLPIGPEGLQHARMAQPSCLELAPAEELVVALDAIPVELVGLQLASHPSATVCCCLQFLTGWFPSRPWKSS